MASESIVQDRAFCHAQARARRRVFLWVAAAAVLLRLLYLVEHSRSAFFHQPVLDEKFFDTVALGLLEGSDSRSVNPAFRSLLYPAYLAAAYAVGGTGAEDWGYTLALLGQHAMGVLTALLIAGLAIRLYGRPAAGAWAAGLYLAASPPLFFEGELLGETLFGLLFLGAVALFFRCREGAPPGTWMAAGAALALAAQVRPNVLIVLLAFGLAAWRLPGLGDARARLGRLAAAGAGTLATLLLFGMLQLPWLGSLSMLPSAGGVNFYLGNKRTADGMIPRQDEYASAGSVYQDSVQIFAESVYRREVGHTGPVDPGRLSRFWLGKTWDEIAAAPLSWAGLLGRKALLLAWTAEIPNNKSHAFILREESPLLRLLPVSFAILLAAAAAGLALGWPRADGVAVFWCLASIALFAAGIVAFFVNARYRLPLWPLLAMLGGGLAAPLELWASRGRRAALAAAAALLLALPNWTGATLPNESRDYFFRSFASFERGDLASARADAEKAVALDPRDTTSAFQLGTVALAQGDDAFAHQIFSRIVFLMPTEARVFNNIGVAAERLGEVAQAYVAYDKATLLSPTFRPPWVNAALIELRAGQLDRAAVRIEHLERLGEDSIPFLCARAFLAIATGRPEEAERDLAAASARDPELVRRLVADHQRRLQPIFQPGPT